jgi:hypothetical protein
MADPRKASTCCPIYAKALGENANSILKNIDNVRIFSELEQPFF